MATVWGLRSADMEAKRAIEAQARADARQTQLLNELKANQDLIRQLIAQMQQAISQGRINTARAIARLIKAMQDDHDALLRAIRSQNDNSVIIREPATSPSPTHNPTKKPCKHPVDGLCPGG
jgi:hypothetical protein